MINKKLVYQALENKMLKYADLAEVPLHPTTEVLVALKPTTNLLVHPIDPNMFAYTGKYIYVRKNVAVMLTRVSQRLKASNPELQLEVVYGYRALSIQQELFNKYKKKLSTLYVGIELLEAVHRLIAVPTVAGHPTGGAVDVQILRSGKPLDLGTKIWQFDQNSYTFSPFVSKQAQVNRQLLRKVMLKVGFAPFDGEWWHFSYGDQEWAKYYNKPFALYEQVEFKKEV